MSRILRLNMADQSFRWEEVSAAYAGLGGRAFTSRLIREEVPPTCHPLSARQQAGGGPGSLDRHAGGQHRAHLGGGQISPHRGHQGEQRRGDRVPEAGPPGRQGRGGGRQTRRRMPGFSW